MLERYELIKRKKGETIAAQRARELRLEHGDEPLPIDRTEISSDQTSKLPSQERIIKEVCEYYNLSRDELIGKRRLLRVYEPRQVAIFLTRTITDFTLDEIGEIYGGRDHSTIHHAAKAISLRAKTDQQLSKDLDALKRKIFSGMNDESGIILRVRPNSYPWEQRTFR